MTKPKGTHVQHPNKYTDEQFEQLLDIAVEANNHARRLVNKHGPYDSFAYKNIDRRAQFLSQFADKNQSKIVQS